MNKSENKKQILDAAETADAAVTAALVLCLLAVGRLLGMGSLLQMVASCVVAVLAARRRSRVVKISTIATACVAIILGGFGPVSYALLAGVFGWVAGQGLKRSWGPWRTILASIAIGWPTMTASLMLFYPAVALNVRLRELVLDNIEDQAIGYQKLSAKLGSLVTGLGLESFGDFFIWWGRQLENMSEYATNYWYVIIPISEFVWATGYSVAIYFISRAVLGRVESSLVQVRNLELMTDPEPVPVPLYVADEPLKRDGVVVANGIELVVSAGEHLVIQGPNGAGKSTLLDTIAGIENDSVVKRSGPIGLGSKGGTARVGQRPEAQVVGANIYEDLSWGVDDPLDLEATKTAFGLSHIEASRPTSDMSGGELQRLALAAAMRREPKLLLADEVTSMLDPSEQARVIANLDALEGTAIVRTSHRDDASSSDRRVKMLPLKKTAPVGEIERSELRQTAKKLSVLRTEAPVPGENLLELHDCSFSHSAGQPWEKQVLFDANLEVKARQLITIEGRNGSGKTTLARILAGLSKPTSGSVLLAKGTQRALARQHVRLQLLRPTVATEVASLAGVKSDGSDIYHELPQRRVRSENMATALELFGLEHMLERRIDSLSGGEQRRVLLAGLVSRGVNLLVLDEPLAGLDADNRSELALTLEKIRIAGTSIVLITHDVDWKPLSCDARYRIDAGRLEKLGDGQPCSGSEL